MGDMNLCALNWNDPGFTYPQLASIVHDFMLSENCDQLVNEYTRIRSVNGSIQRSCLDHITTNCVSKMSRPEVLGLSKSDHLGISIIKKSKEIRTSPNTTKKRIYKNFDKEAFVAEIREAKQAGTFENVFHQNDIDNAIDIFSDLYNSILNKHAPLKIIQNRSDYVPYVSK